jgi:nucleoside-diphosphate-sugar epimerase
LGRVLVTGGAGRIATALRAGLDRPLRLLDIVPAAPDPSARDEVVVGDLCSPALMASACEGVDAVVHLGGIPTEAPFADLLRVNVDGTRVVLEAAAAAGVPRVVLASSIHAAGFYPRPGAPGEELPATAPPRPDSYYGWTKAAMESLGRLYADRFGMAVLALRIGAFIDRPDPAHLDSWLSPADGVRLVAACLDTPMSGFRVIWGVSANPGRWLSLTEGQEIGYLPRDASPAAASPDATPLGTIYSVHPLGRPL